MSMNAVIRRDALYLLHEKGPGGQALARRRRDCFGLFGPVPPPAPFS